MTVRVNRLKTAFKYKIYIDIEKDQCKFANACLDESVISTLIANNNSAL